MDKKKKVGKKDYIEYIKSKLSFFLDLQFNIFSISQLEEFCELINGANFCPYSPDELMEIFLGIVESNEKFLELLDLRYKNNIEEERKKREERKIDPELQAIYDEQDIKKENKKINFIMKIMLDLFPSYYDAFNKCIIDKKGKLVGYNFNFLGNLKDFVKIIVDCNYNKQFLLFLRYFYINGNQINQDSFEKEVSIQKKSKKQ